MPDIDIDTENESEIFYQLPDDQVHLFQEVFTDLEQNVTALSLNSYGVSLTTMEEIFLKFGKDSVQLNGVKMDEIITDIPQNNADTPLTINEAFLLQGTPLLSNQAIAMFKKRFLCWLRSWKYFMYYNVIAVIVLAPIILQGYSFTGDATGLPSLDISLNAYKEPIALVQEINWPNTSLSKK